jgi:membrane protease YdiL (CAAX protease family)
MALSIFPYDGRSSMTRAMGGMPWSSSAAPGTRGRFDFVVRLAAAFLLTLVLVPVVAMALPGVAFHRLLTRTLLILILAIFLLGRGSPRTWGESLRAMGLRGPGSASRFVLGAAVSVVLFAIILGLSWVAGGRPLESPVPSTWPRDLAVAALTGVGVGILEETLWRGYLRGLLGAVVSSILYAAAHYFRPLTGSPVPPGPYDPFMAVRRLPEMFQSLSEPRHLTLGLLSLFLLGMALCRLRERTGTLWLGMGVHAGFVLSIAVYRDFFAVNAHGSPWIYGGTRLHDGLLATVALALLFWLAARGPLPRSFLDASDNRSQNRVDAPTR